MDVVPPEEPAPVLARELHSGGARLVDLCGYYGIDTGQSHRALDDTKSLALVFLALGETKVARTSPM